MSLSVPDKRYMFVMPGFLHGAARVFDLAGAYDDWSYALSGTPAEADRRAAAADIETVLRDYATAADVWTQQEADEERPR